MNTFATSDAQEHLSFCICIPTYNRFDLLLPAILYYVINFPDTQIIIYDNGNQLIKERLSGIRNIRTHRHPYKALTDNITVLGGYGINIGVSAAWNILLKTAFNERNYSHVLMLNDDVMFNGRQEELLAWIRSNNSFDITLYVCTPKFDWSSFIISKKVFEKVGLFDESMRLYYSDNDMELRVIGARMYVERVQYLNPAVFTRSGSLLKDPALQDIINNDLEKYIEKWGGRPGEETFDKPYNKNLIL